MTTAAAPSRTVVRARWYHLATFAVGLVTLTVQTILIVAETDPAALRGMSLAIRLWNLVSYFTIWSNILVTVVAFLLWRDPNRDGPYFRVFRMAGLTMITVTGVVYGLVLAATWSPTGWTLVADRLLHYAMPSLAVIGFLVFGPRPRFDQIVLWCSALVPLVWGVYTFVRCPFITLTENGESRDWYPYPFIDVGEIGYARAIVNVLGVTLLLVLVGQVYVYLDRKLSPTPR
jgi:hypothetical protein